MNLNVLLLSGGTRVAVHVGALRAIEESGAHVAAWAGVSAGSLVAAVRACGYTQQEAYELMLHTDYRRFRDARPWSLLRGFGLFAGDAFESWLDDVLEGRTFADLAAPLTVVACDVAAGRPAVFSREKTPDVKIATAVRCSISIPGVFAARRVAGRVLVDGCLARVEPQLLFSDITRPSAIVRMMSDRTAALPDEGRLNLSGYVRRIAELVADSVGGAPPTEEWDHDLCVDVARSRGIDFSLGCDEKRQLHDLAYEQCRRLLMQAAPQRRIRPELSARRPPTANPTVTPDPRRQLSMAGVFG